MSYIPPAYNEVDGDFETGYTPPAYNAVDGDLFIISGSLIEAVISLSFNVGLYVFDDDMISIEVPLSITGELRSENVDGEYNFGPPQPLEATINIRI